MNNLQCILPSLYMIIGAVCAWIGMFIHDRGKAKKERKDELERKVFNLGNHADRLGCRIADLDEEITYIKNEINRRLTQHNKETNNE